MVAEAIEDKQTKESTLSEMAHTLAGLGAFDQALTVTEAIPEWYRAITLSGVAKALAQSGEKQKAADVASQALTATEAIEEPIVDTGIKGSTLSKVAQALVEAGQPALTQRVLCMAFTTARLAGRESVFETLTYGALALAAVDQGQTLWQVHEAVTEVEGWSGIGRIEVKHEA